MKLAPLLFFLASFFALSATYNIDTWDMGIMGMVPYIQVLYHSLGVLANTILNHMCTSISPSHRHRGIRNKKTLNNFATFLRHYIIILTLPEAVRRTISCSARGCRPQPRPGVGMVATERK
jgi:hypothetical protein